MIRADMIPDDVVEAASREYELYIYDVVSADGIRLAIAAALNAWPGMLVDHRDWPECHLMVLPPAAEGCRMLNPKRRDVYSNEQGTSNED